MLPLNVHVYDIGDTFTSLLVKKTAILEIKYKNTVHESPVNFSKRIQVKNRPCEVSPLVNGSSSKILVIVVSLPANNQVVEMNQEKVEPFWQSASFTRNNPKYKLVSSDLKACLIKMHYDNQSRRFAAIPSVLPLKLWFMGNHLPSQS